MTSETMSAPKPTLNVVDAVAIMVGIVIGIGIFKTPPLVAANVGSELAFIGAWVFGGFVTLIGALCYAELASAYPHAGGEYHFLSRAYGRHVAVLFGWARGSVIQTGAIAAVAFVFGDYAAQIFPLGVNGPAIYAALAIAILTALNVLGTLQSKTAQNAMTILTVFAVAIVIFAGLFGGVEPAAAPAPAASASGSASGAFGMAMIFVLLTYGGWSETAYLSAELKDAPRNMSRVLLIGTAVLVTVYALVNFAFLSGLGLEGLRGSSAAGADLMRAVAGETGALILSLIVVAAALSTLNGTIFTGARVYYAMARDLSVLPQVGQWDDRGGTPANGLLLQGTVALGLVGMGAATRDGFQSMVDYTAPVFWSFLFLVGLALIVLRWREPGRTLPFRVPLYPLTPILFCLTCLFMLYASLAYTGIGALIGLAVIAAGAPLLLLGRPQRKPVAAEGQGVGGGS